MAQNGKLDPSSLKRLSVGGYLTPGAADAFEGLRSAGSRAGVNVTITSTADAYRLYAIQERIFTERYQTTYIEYAKGRVDKRSWQGRDWFRRPGTAAAAVPGTSNHGWGLAVDIANVGGFNSTFYRWLIETGPRFGFTNDEGHSVGEAWHWVYSPTVHASNGGNTTAPGTTTPTTPTEGTDMPLTNDEIDRIAHRVWTFQNGDLEQADAYAILRAGRDGTVAANKVHDLLTPGKEGVKPEGDILGRLGRIEAEANAAQQNTRPITRNGVEVSLRQEIANIGTAVTNLPTRVWAYANTVLETGDVYSILRAIRDKVVGK